MFDGRCTAARFFNYLFRNVRRFIISPFLFLLSYILLIFIYFLLWPNGFLYLIGGNCKETKLIET